MKLIGRMLITSKLAYLVAGKPTPISLRPPNLRAWAREPSAPLKKNSMLPSKRLGAHWACTGFRLPMLEFEALMGFSA
jgi:hypothetical protein